MSVAIVMNSCKGGYLELILGPMFSGKTTKLIKYYQKYDAMGKNVAVINHIYDKHLSNNTLSSHDNVEIPCSYSNTLNEELWMDADIVLINEGQFFDDVVPAVTNMVEGYGKHVYVCGLDGDYRRCKFGKLLDLIPLCDRVEKLFGECSMCNDKTSAIFSHRVSDEQTQIVVGSSNYMPLCRCCYKSMQLA